MKLLYKFVEVLRAAAREHGGVGARCRGSLASILCLGAVFCSSPVLGANAYQALTRAGTDYLIAAVGIEQFKGTECAYVFEKVPVESVDEVRQKVFPRMTPEDRKEVDRQLPLLRSDRETLTRLIPALRKAYDEKTACGMLAGHAITQLVKARTRWEELK